MKSENTRLEWFLKTFKEECLLPCKSKFLCRKIFFVPLSGIETEQGITALIIKSIKSIDFHELILHHQMHIKHIQSMMMH